MLLTLSYLRTSDDDRSDHHFSLSAFRGLIIKCLFCPIYKARRLAARILFQLHVQSDMEDILIQLVTPENMAHGNRAHGALLFIHQLIASKKDDAASDVCQMAVMRLEELQWILSRGSRILQELYYEVCLEAIDLNKLSNASALTIRNFAIDDVLNCEGKHYSLNHPQTRIVLSGLLMDNRDSLETLIRLLNHQEYEVSLTTIDWISSRSFDGSILISLVDVLIKILVTDYVYNDLARGAGNLLANIVSSKDILLTTKQITSIQDILKDRKRRHMMDVLLPLAGSVVSNGTVTVDKLQLMSLLDIYLQLLSEFNREEEVIAVKLLSSFLNVMETTEDPDSACGRCLDPPL